MENMSESTDEFQDWEVLPSKSCLNSGDSFHDIHSGPFIQPNHFSADACNPSSLDEFDDNKSADSGNLSWIDPGSDENPVRYLYKESGEFWSDSSSAQSDDIRTGDSVGKNCSCLFERQVGSGGISEVGNKTMEKTEVLDNFCSEPAPIEEASEKFDYSVQSSVLNKRDASTDEMLQKESIGRVGGSVVNGNENHKAGEIKRSGVLWWKMPMELLKCCLFRMSPMWTVSVAAALMGFVILGRRLYKMKTKTKILEIRVALDDKKASQVMSRAARLNESFSVVKRVPVIRPSLPAVGVTTWPAMNFR
ncbi:hypothetical protein F511_10469 [Dorcoceras hygrometricum]|uniref:DUF6821 domain-containing protein n=1 Tax=Dorcoceras hygrometricum TaxID=472368 RepID=A0A2Z7CVZ0_9LAMI|nr:hypothetical protein F511_10469 [Dorcoceras hygrometricum]